MDNDILFYKQKKGFSISRKMCEKEKRETWSWRNQRAFLWQKRP